MPIWGFVFALAAAIVFLIEAWLHRSLIAAGLCLLAVGFIFTFATSSSPVHF
jgi:hypothetical protein